MQDTPPAAEAAAAPAPITVTIDDGPLTPDVGDLSTGWRASVLLDPEARDVRIWARVGPGAPEAICHERMLTVPLSEAAAGQSVREAVRANVATVEAIFNLWQGVEVSARGERIGTWGGERGALDGLLGRLEGVLGEVACHWSAATWLQPNWGESKREVEAAMLADRDLDELASEWASEGANDDALLDTDDLRASIDKMARELLEDGDEAVYVVSKGGAEPLGDGDNLPPATGFGETWKVVEARGTLDAVLKARALDVAGTLAELERVLDAWESDYVAPLAAHLGRALPT